MQQVVKHCKTLKYEDLVHRITLIKYKIKMQTLLVHTYTIQSLLKIGHVPPHVCQTQHAVGAKHIKYRYTRPGAMHTFCYRWPLMFLEKHCCLIISDRPSWAIGNVCMCVVQRQAVRYDKHMQVQYHYEYYSRLEQPATWVRQSNSQFPCKTC